MFSGCHGFIPTGKRSVKVAMNLMIVIHVIRTHAVSDHKLKGACPNNFCKN